MKIRNYLLVLSLLFSLPQAFAEDYTTDIYEEEANTHLPAATKKASTSLSYKDPVRSENKSYPRFEGYLLSEFYIDALDNSTDKVQFNDKKTNTYINLEALMRLEVGKGFFAETKWYLQPVNERVYTNDFYAKNSDYIIGNDLTDDFYGKNNYVRRRFQFSSYGLGIETLNIGYKNKNLAVALGKINPSFGSAFDKARFSGIYGVSMAEEYELTEKIGGYVSALFPFGNISFNLFYDDTTSLSDTMFKNRGRDRSYGGAGNTEKLNNFSITFDGHFDNLSVNAGFRYLDVDTHQESPEKGFVIGAEYLIEFPYDVNFLPFMEVAYLNNYDGMKSRNVTYWTTFLPIIIENWHLIFSNTSKFDNEKYFGNYTSHLTQISFGYKFDFGLMVDIAKVWERYVKKADDFKTIAPGRKWVKHADSWAFMVSYLFKF